MRIIVAILFFPLFILFGVCGFVFMFIRCGFDTGCNTFDELAAWMLKK